MKVTLSSIAWQPSEEAGVAALMQSLKVRAVEIAPTKIWPEPLRATEKQAKAYRSGWESRGIEIVAMQSLLFGKPDLALFESEAKRRETADYLKGILRLGHWLGARVAVFGSPKNRRLGHRPREQALAMAQSFFQEMGEEAESLGMLFCVEPNPAAYACDFITTSREGCQWVDRVNQPGFRLHLDAAAMTMSREPAEEAIAYAGRRIRHFHASEVNLAPVGSGSVDHGAFASALRKIDYPHWVSIEMRAAEGGNVAAVEKALRFVLETYAGSPRP